MLTRQHAEALDEMALRRVELDRFVGASIRGLRPETFAPENRQRALGVGEHTVVVGTAPAPHRHPVLLVGHVLGLVRRLGAAGALAELRRTRPPLDALGYHDTRAVYLVWAVDRLIEAGLSDLGVLWHPLSDWRSPLAWWDAETLESDAARQRFVPPTAGEDWEPRPAEPAERPGV